MSGCDLLRDFDFSVPAPLLPIFRRSHSSTLDAGTSFSLTCLITPNTTGVDTIVSVQSDVAGPGTSHSDRVSVSQPMSVGGGVYETVVNFRHLFEADSGSYNCSAMLISSQDNIIASDSTSAAETIDVGRKCMVL